MNNRILAAGLALAATVAVISVVASQSPPDVPYSQYADVNGDGVPNVADLGIVASQYNKTVLANPCVAWIVIDDAHPDPSPINGMNVVNTLQEVITPQRGGQYIVPPSHPAWGILASGSAFPLRACP